MNRENFLSYEKYWDNGIQCATIYCDSKALGQFLSCLFVSLFFGSLYSLVVNKDKMTLQKCLLLWTCLFRGMDPLHISDWLIKQRSGVV